MRVIDETDRGLDRKHANIRFTLYAPSEFESQVFFDNFFRYEFCVFTPRAQAGAGGS
jgi:hypothetical protein